jgi:hypothetical protein
VATGHDQDFHCFWGSTSECEYLKIVVDKVRAGSTLPILALDQGGTASSSSPNAELPGALANAGYTGAGEVVTVNPADATAFNAVAFVDGEGHPNYSAIITASDETCGGCDDNEAGENNINARAKDFETYFNGGGGILALAGASRFPTYYSFVPLKVAATAVAPPFTVTPEGEKLGITNEMANCCVTHNSFSTPPSPFVVLENDNAGQAETIAAFGAKIKEEEFEPGGCSKVEGEASGTVNKERQRAVDKLSTNLLEKQSFTFTWENGLEKAQLVKLNSASCVVTAGGRKKFTGAGTASYNSESGYTIKFAISVTKLGVDEVVMFLYKGKEKVASFKFAAKAAETIS